MRLVVIFSLFILNFVYVCASEEDPFDARSHRMVEDPLPGLEVPLVLSDGQNINSLPEQLRYFKEKIENQEKHIQTLSQSIDRADGVMVEDLLRRKLLYVRGSYAAGFFGFTLNSIAPVVTVIATAAGGPTYINYVTSGLAAVGTGLLGLVVYLKSSAEKMGHDIAAIHEQEKLELAKLKAAYNALTKDLNMVAVQERAKQEFALMAEEQSIKKREAKTREAEAKAKTAQAQEALVRARLPVRKRPVNRRKKAVIKTSETTPLLLNTDVTTGEKGKEEEK